MSILPEWAPNVHPLIVHFPIAVLFTAVIFDGLSNVFRKHSWLAYCAGALYILGALGAIAAYFSGKQAADLVDIPANANPVLSEHADYGFYTAWFFGIFGLFRLAGLWKQWFQNVTISLVSLVIALGGTFLLFETAELGAELVFHHGVGVQAAEKARKAEAERKADEQVLRENSIVESGNGSWEWHPGKGAEIVLEKKFKWWVGNVDSLEAKVRHDSSGNEKFALTLRNHPVLFTAWNALQGVQVDLRVNTDDFSGNIMLVHHVQDAKTFDFVRFADGEMQLGRMVNGNTKIEDRDASAASGWVDLRAVGQGGHFRGYVNEKMVTHGHAKDLPPGPAGLYIDGSGTLLIDKLVVKSVN